MDYTESLDTRGTKRVLIVDYFQEKSGIVDIDDYFYMDGCEIHIAKEGKVQLGKLEFPQVLLTITGEKQRVQHIVKRFRIDFLSVGG